MDSCFFLLKVVITLTLRIGIVIFVCYITMLLLLFLEVILLRWLQPMLLLAIVIDA